MKYLYTLLTCLILVITGYSDQPVFQAQYSITGVEVNEASWRITGNVIDLSPLSYTAEDVLTNDVIFCYSIVGDIDRYKVTNILTQSGSSLICDIVYDEVGSPRFGPQAGYQIIVRGDTNITYLPALTFSSLAEYLHTGARNKLMDRIIYNTAENWSGYPAVTNVDLGNQIITNVAAIDLGGETRTNWGVITASITESITNEVVIEDGEIKLTIRTDYASAGGAMTTNHNALLNLQGGDVDDYQHLTLAQYTSITGANYNSRISSMQADIDTLNATAAALQDATNALNRGFQTTITNIVLTTSTSNSLSINRTTKTANFVIDTNYSKGVTIDTNMSYIWAPQTYGSTNGHVILGSGGGIPVLAYGADTTNENTIQTWLNSAGVPVATITDLRSIFYTPIYGNGAGLWNIHDDTAITNVILSYGYYNDASIISNTLVLTLEPRNSYDQVTTRLIEFKGIDFNNILGETEPYTYCFFLTIDTDKSFNSTNVFNVSSTNVTGWTYWHNGIVTDMPTNGYIDVTALNTYNACVTYTWTNSIRSFIYYVRGYIIAKMETGEQVINIINTTLEPK